MKRTTAKPSRRLTTVKVTTEVSSFFSTSHFLWMDERLHNARTQFHVYFLKSVVLVSLVLAVIISSFFFVIYFALLLPLLILSPKACYRVPTDAESGIHRRCHVDAIVVDEIVSVTRNPWPFVCIRWMITEPTHFSSTETYFRTELANAYLTFIQTTKIVSVHHLIRRFCSSVWQISHTHIRFTIYHGPSGGRMSVPFVCISHSQHSIINFNVFIVANRSAWSHEMLHKM